MSKLSEKSQELWSNGSRSLDISEFEYCMNEWQSAHNKKMMSKYVIMILLFCAGLWALSARETILAVILLAIAANFNLISAHHILISESMNMQRLLAMLINKQSQNIESLRREIKGL